MIVDVEATAPIRQAEVGCVRDMIVRTRDRFGLIEKLVADTAYGSGPMLGWLVEEEGIEPYIPVIDKSVRADGTFSREDFRVRPRRSAYVCPAGKQLVQFRRTYKTPRLATGDKAGMKRYRAAKSDCDVCSRKPRCCPKEGFRQLPLFIHEGALDMARAITKTDAYVTASYARKKVEMLFAHLKRIMKLDRLRLRGRTVPKTSSSSPQPPRTSANWPSWCHNRRRKKPRGSHSDIPIVWKSEFFNGIGSKRTFNRGAVRAAWNGSSERRLR